MMLLTRILYRKLRRRGVQSKLLGMLLVCFILLLIRRKISPSRKDHIPRASLKRHGEKHEYADSMRDEQAYHRDPGEGKAVALGDAHRIDVLEKKGVMNNFLHNRNIDEKISELDKLKKKLGFEVEDIDTLGRANKNNNDQLNRGGTDRDPKPSRRRKQNMKIGHEDRMKFKAIEDRIKERTKKDILELGEIGRDLPDVRPNDCRHRTYPDNLLKASIIIVFYDEGLKTLLRSIHSIIKRSPQHLVSEIILIDDCSTQEHYTKELKVQLKEVDYPIVVKRTKQRFGWVLARVQGAEYATGDVIVFLDGHTEVTDGWLEPLLARISENPQNVVYPVIDHIDPKTLEYVPESGQFLNVGVFDWSLDVTWQRTPRIGHDPTSPIASPVMADAVFAMRKDYFNKLDGYDSFYTTEDTADLDLSFKVWMCGGFVEQIPCSHVGHLHRHSLPFQLPGRGEVNDKRRLVEIWFGTYKNFFYSIIPNAKDESPGDLTDEEVLVKKMKCRSIQWYWETVYPESIWPIHGERYGELRHTGTGKCLDIEVHEKNHHQEEGAVTNIVCDGAGSSQIWMMTAKGEVKNNFLCLESLNGESVTASKCHGQKSNQEWMFDSAINRVYHTATQRCMHATSNDQVILEKCEPSPAQSWNLKSRDQELADVGLDKIGH